MRKILTHVDASNQKELFVSCNCKVQRQGRLQVWLSPKGHVVTETMRSSCFIIHPLLFGFAPEPIPSRRKVECWQLSEPGASLVIGRGNWASFCPIFKPKSDPPFDCTILGCNFTFEPNLGQGLWFAAFLRPGFHSVFPPWDDACLRHQDGWHWFAQTQDGLPWWFRR